MAGLAASSFSLAPASAELSAARIDAGNFARLRAGGPDAATGLGDWALSNGTLCAGVSDPSHENDLSTTGGTLMDLGHCGRGDDQFLIFEQIVNLSTRTLVPIARVDAEQNASGARLLTHGSRDGLALETVYALDLAEPTRLRIRSRIEREQPGARLFGFGTAIANVNALTPFAFDTRELGPSRGFSQLPFFGLPRDAMASAAVPADLLVLVGDAGLEPGIAYAVRQVTARLEPASGEPTDLPRLLLSDDVANITAVFARPFWIGDGRSLGTLQLLQTQLMDLALGDALVIEQEIWVGSRADVASATERMQAAEPLVRGRIDDARASLFRAGCSRRAGDAGAAGARRPFRDAAPARQLLAAGRPAGGREVEGLVPRRGAGSSISGSIEAGAPSQVRLPRGEPMRLVFLGQDGTPDPSFGDDLLGFTVAGREVRAQPRACAASRSAAATPIPSRWRSRPAAIACSPRAVPSFP